MAILKMLMEAGCNLKDVGFICLSRSRKNHVESTAIGGAAYWSNMEILEYLMLWSEQEEKRE